MYYAGDFDSGWSGADGSLNGNFDGGSVFAQTRGWHKTAAGGHCHWSYLNQFFTSGFVGTNPTPFQATSG